MNIETLAAMLLDHGWRLVLAFTAAIFCVALLRRPCRRLFGAQRSYQLWLLPLLAMLASQWPHAPNAIQSQSPLPALVYMITSAAVPSSLHASIADVHGWRAVVLVAWGLGMLLVGWRAIRGQSHYRRALLGATAVVDVPSSTTLLRASHADVGPALVGAWSPRIVVPVDFESRYDPAERALIVAHERIHARRRDGFSCLIAQLLAAVFWFNPLAWWALGALRHDQELACDAAVLSEHRVSPRLYANAMLKTQPSMRRLPVGCSWSPRHPITERIAMLKQTPPSQLRTRLGLVAGLVLGTIVSGVVYAASQPAGSAAAQSISPVGAGEYQLDIMVASFSQGKSADHAVRETVGVCTNPGEPAGVNNDSWQLEAKVKPLDSERVGVALKLSTADGKPLESRRLEGRLGEPMLAEFNDAHGKPAYTIDVTPLAGCPARVAESGAAARLTMIKQSIKNQPVRTVVESMATQAGLDVVNPQDLSMSPVTLNFDQIPAERALQLMADIDGKQATFHGKQVSFEAK